MGDRVPVSRSLRDILSAAPTASFFVPGSPSATPAFQRALTIPAAPVHQAGPAAGGRTDRVPGTFTGMKMGQDAGP